MNSGELAFSPFTHFDTFGKNNFLIVHSSLVDKSELIVGDSFLKCKRCHDFITFSYTDISGITKKISEQMFSKGIKKQELVPILTDNPFDIVLGVISLWTLRAIPVPLNIHLLRKDLTSQINFLNAEHFVYQAKHENHFPGLNRFSMKRHSAGEVKFQNDFTPSDTAVVLFTSGTGGKPKAVPLSFRNLIAAYESGYSMLHYSDKDLWYLNLPLYHIGGFSILVRAILAGSYLILPESNELASLKINLEKVKPTLISLVPTQLKRICEEKILPNKELRAALIGGSFSDEKILSSAVKLGWNIYKVYGSTETSAFVTTLKAEEIPLKTNSAGKPLPTVEIKIFDDNKIDLKVNKTGEVAVKAASVFSSYLFNNVATKLVFNDEYYLTGDFGFLDADGFLYLENRRTDLIVSGGENISPSEIELAISRFVNIDEVCVIGLPDVEWGERVTAIITTINKSEINTSELMNYLREKLPSYKIPKKIISVESFPKTAIGKINRAKVKKMFYPD